MARLCMRGKRPDLAAKLVLQIYCADDDLKVKAACALNLVKDLLNHAGDSKVRPILAEILRKALASGVHGRPVAERLGANLRGLEVEVAREAELDARLEEVRAEFFGRLDLGMREALEYLRLEAYPEMGRWFWSVATAPRDAIRMDLLALLRRACEDDGSRTGADRYLTARAARESGFYPPGEFENLRALGGGLPAPPPDLIVMNESRIERQVPPEIAHFLPGGGARCVVRLSDPVTSALVTFAPDARVYVNGEWAGVQRVIEVDATSLCVPGTLNKISAWQFEPYRVAVTARCTRIEVLEYVRGRRLGETRTRDMMRALAGGEDDDVTLARECVSLRCPLGIGRIRVPVRGAECVHHACFDLETYVDSGIRKCPVCDRSVHLADLSVDPYYEELLRVAGPDVDRVYVDGDGKPIEGPSKRKREPEVEI